jgi:SAM-dependent methyltransferase
MNWTGERMVADYSMSKGAVEHLHRYGIIQPYIPGKVVLDIASGEGYGSNLIAQLASLVFGVDISVEAIEHATNKYQKENLKFLVGSAIAVPLEDNSVDVVVSFETIEHHDQHDLMLKELKRIMKPDGVLILSTPERENYKKIDPDNPYHKQELSFSEFECLVKKYFSTLNMFHQRFFDVSFIYPASGSIGTITEYAGDFCEIRKMAFEQRHLFNIAICSNNPNFKPLTDTSFFNAEGYWKKRIEEIDRLAEARIAEAIKTVRSSNSYRLGNFFLRPFSAVKRLLRN